MDDGVHAAPDDEAIRLTVTDAPEMLALVAETRPGPFLHAAASNVNAIGLYESLDFRLRRNTDFMTVRVPS